MTCDSFWDWRTSTHICSFHPKARCSGYSRAKRKWAMNFHRPWNGDAFLFERALDTVDGRNSPTTTWDVSKKPTVNNGKKNYLSLNCRSSEPSTHQQYVTEPYGTSSCWIPCFPKFISLRSLPVMVDLHRMSTWSAEEKWGGRMGRLGSRSPRKNKKDTIINRWYMTIYENYYSMFDISQMQKLILIKLIGRCLSSECLLKLCKLFGTLLICFISLDWYSWFVWDVGALCHILA